MRDAATVLWYLASAAGLAEAVRKMFANCRAGHALGSQYLSAGLALMALAMATGAPTTVSWVTTVTGAGNVAVVVQCVLAMAAMVCAAGFLRALDQLRHRVRMSAATCALCVTAMTILFIVEGTADPAFGSPRDPGLASRLYAAIYLTYMGVWLVRYIHALWLVGRVGEPAVQVGVMLAGVGMAIELCGVLFRLGVISSAISVPSTRVAAIGDAIGFMFFVAGSAYASTMRRVHARAERARTRRQVESVDRLWRLLRPVFAQPGSRVEARVSLQQKIVEIFDARLILTRFVDADLCEQAVAQARRRRFGRRQADCLLAAVELRLGLRAYLSRIQRCRSAMAGAANDQFEAETDAWPEAEDVFVDDDQRGAWLADVADLVDSSGLSAIVRRLDGAMGWPRRDTRSVP